MNGATVSRFRADLLSWARENLRSFPWRNPDANVYEVFIAEFFLTQTPAQNVSEVYEDFLSRFPDLVTIRSASREDLKDAIEPLGFQNRRARALSTIAAECDELPMAPAKLQELERVGPYVANATVCFALGEPLPIVDRNVRRVYGRLFGEDWPTSSGAELEAAAEVLPDDDARTYNLALLDFAALVCQREPKCEECFASSYCPSSKSHD